MDWLRNLEESEAIVRMWKYKAVVKNKLFLRQNCFKIRVGGRLFFFFNQLISEKFLQNHKC